LLGAFDESGAEDVELPDPYAHPYAATEIVCRRIIASIDGLLRRARTHDAVRVERVIPAEVAGR
jgi:hypothetical protein